MNILPPPSTSIVKTIQTYSITIGASSNTGTATLGTAVTTARAVISDGGVRGGDATDIREGQAHVVLTDSTTVTATRSNNDGVGTLTATGFVVEFN